MHPLLTRQLKQTGLADQTLPANVTALLEAVDAAYTQSDDERSLCERALDLTSKELLERNRELTGRNKELAALREAGLDCIITMDHEGKIREFNPAAERAFGVRRQDVTGKRLADVVIPQRFRASHAAGLAAYVKNGDGPVIGKRIEVPAMRSDQTEFPVELAISAVKVDGKPLFVAYLRDITDRKRAEEESRRAEKLALVASRTDNAVIITDLHGNIEWVNDGFTRISGYTLGEVIGKKPGSFLQGPDTSPETVEFMRSHLVRGEGFRAEIVNYGKDRRKYWLGIEVQPIYDAAGALRNFMAIESDITERKRVEEELHAAKEQAEAASRSKSEFLANMSHEIRTPLNGVSGMTDLLLGTELDVHQRRYVQIAKSSADALLLVINQILDFSKIEAGKMDLEAIDFDLATVVEEVMEMLVYRAASKGLELAYRIDPAVPPCLRGDPARLRQVLTNLVNNAVKFTHQGQVIIRIGVQSQSAGRVTLKFTVIDSGVGIAPERRDRLFKAFSQIDASTTRKFGGTGLGLAICKQLAELMGGQIGVESTEGRGSTFWFTANFVPIASVARPKAPVDVAGIRVLALDDNQAVREILCEQLASWGLRVSEAADAEEGMRRIRQAASQGQPYSLVVLDSGLSGGTGLKLARTIHTDAQLPATSLILLTTIDNPVEPAEAKAAGLFDAVTKPLRQSQLFDAVIRAAAAAKGCPFAPATFEKPLPAQLLSLRQARVLLAEDNEVNQIVASEILSKAGFECDIVADGKQAFDAVRKQEYDIVLMDCQMPEMDGFQATQAIRKWEKEQAAAAPLRRVPIIALTANALKGDRDQCIAAGMDDYLSKPLDPRQLVMMLNRLLAPRVPGSDKAADASATHKPTEVTTPEVDPPMDLDALLERCMGDDQFRDRLLQKFAEQAQVSVEKIDAALAGGDAQQLARAAHGLKGTAANLSAPYVRQIAAEIEALGNQQMLESAEKLVDSLRIEVGRCLDFMRQAPVPVSR